MSFQGSSLHNQPICSHTDFTDEAVRFAYPEAQLESSRAGNPGLWLHSPCSSHHITLSGKHHDISFVLSGWSCGIILSGSKTKKPKNTHVEPWCLPSTASCLCLKLKIMSPYLPPAFDKVRSVAWGTNDGCLSSQQRRLGPEGCWQTSCRDPGLLVCLHSTKGL